MLAFPDSELDISQTSAEGAFPIKLAVSRKKIGLFDAAIAFASIGAITFVWWAWNTAPEKAQSYLIFAVLGLFFFVRFSLRLPGQFKRFAEKRRHRNYT